VPLPLQGALSLLLLPQNRLLPLLALKLLFRAPALTPADGFFAGIAGCPEILQVAAGQVVGEQHYA